MLAPFGETVVDKPDVVFASFIALELVAEVKVDDIVDNVLNASLVPGGVLRIARYSSMNVVAEQD